MLSAVIGLSILQSESSTASRIIEVTPIRLASFQSAAQLKPRKQGSEPTTTKDLLIFEATTDGNRQIDPQIAVGGGYVFHPTNSGSAIFDRAGKFIAGTSNDVFQGGIDPKLVFDTVNRVFCYDVWKYYDGEKLKPIHFSVSESDNPLGAWNT